MKLTVKSIHSVFSWSWDTRISTNDINHIDHNGNVDNQFVHNENINQLVGNVINDNIKNNNIDNYSYITNYNLPNGRKLHIDGHSQMLNENDSTNSNNIENDDDGDDDDDDKNICGICQSNFNGTCPTCSIPGDKCPLVIGNCQHNFHYHCIVRWLNTKNSKGLCPMCRQDFILNDNIMLNRPFKLKINIIRERIREQIFLEEAEDPDANLDIDLINNEIEQGSTNTNGNEYNDNISSNDPNNINSNDNDNDDINEEASDIYYNSSHSDISLH